MGPVNNVNISTRKAAARPGRLRALLVEQNWAVAGTVAGYLDEQEFVVEVAYSAPDTLSLSSDFDPDIIVVGLSQSDTERFEMARELRAMTDSYLLILTENSQELCALLDSSVCLADDYLCKPLSPEELVTRIRASYDPAKWLACLARDIPTRRPGLSAPCASTLRRVGCRSTTNQ
jgi:DNA-binding response OmpR family regulator